MLSSLMIFMVTVAILASPLAIVPVLCWMAEQIDIMVNGE